MLRSVLMILLNIGFNLVLLLLHVNAIKSCGHVIAAEVVLIIVCAG